MAISDAQNTKSTTMSFEEEWPLLDDPTQESVQAAISALCEETETPSASVRLHEGTILVTFRVPVHSAARLVQRAARDSRPLDEIRSELDPPRGVFDAEAAEHAGCAFRETIDGITRVTYDDAERFTRAPDHYTLVIAVDAAEPDEGAPPRVSIYSNTDDNREGWVVAVALAEALALRMGILPDRGLN